MPAYSFQEQFIAYIEDESKDHTVRKERNGRAPHAKPGDTIFLYYGMRTKDCRKIGEATCRAYSRILIQEDSIFFDYGGGFRNPLSPIQCDQFAWKDGFRPEGSTFEKSQGAFALMIKFLGAIYQFPFYGVVIYWKHFKASASSIAPASL